MIVEPDFLTHWKTRALVRMLDYELAPMCVVAFWAHCQQRRTDRFHGLTAEVFSSICGWPFLGEPSRFYDAMLACGFIEVEGDTLIAHDFAKANAQLFANWQNGLRGGRPSETHRKPIANPLETHSGNGVTDREEKIEKRREDKETVALKRQPVRSELPECLDSEDFRDAWSAWETHRKQKRNSVTPSSRDAQLRKLAAWGHARALAAVKHSTACGYTGIFEEKEQANGTHNRPVPPAPAPKGVNVW